jgi:branched-chain amino acid transport system substrate-binding protein
MRTTATAALAGLLAFTGVAEIQAAEMKVGLLLPYSGVYASLGQEIDDGFALALETYGKDVGVEFEMVREDSEAKPPVGLSKTRKLVLQDKVDVIVGVVSSGVLGAIRDMVHSAKVPLVVANAGNDEATGENCSPYVIRVSFSNSQVNRPMGDWLYGQGVRKVFTLGADYAAGHQMVGAFVDSFTAAGGEIVGQEFTPFQKTQDFGPYLTSAKSSGADAVFVFYAGGEAISFVKQYDSFGLKSQIPLYGSGFLTSPLYVAAEGPAADKVITSLHYVPTIDTPENKEFVAAFEKKTSRLPSEYAVHGYDAGRAIVEAVKAGATDRESLAEALPKISFNGPRGPFAIDPATNNIVQNIYVYETVVGDGSPTQKIIDVIPEQRDPPNGCSM